MDIAAFFSAYFSDWVGYMSGIGSIALSIFGLTRPNGNQKKAFVSAAVICMLIAPVHIWTLEHQARIAAEDANTPRLDVQISDIFTGHLSTGETIFILIMSAINRGAPSIVSLQEVDVDLADGRTIKAKLMPPSVVDTQMEGKGSVPSMTFLRNDYILAKWTTTPIAKGGFASGWGSFVLPGVPRTSIVSGRTKIRIHRLDVYNKAVDAQAILTDNPENGFFYRGTNP